MLVSVHCNEALPKVQTGGASDIAATLSCNIVPQDFAVLPADGMQIETLLMSDLGQGKRIYIRTQLELPCQA
jgi:hypothetical protein